MKNVFESQFESLIRRRFQDRDTRFLACLREGESRSTTAAGY